jgi:hypothetical protein
MNQAPKAPAVSVSSNPDLMRDMKWRWPIKEFFYCMNKRRRFPRLPVLNTWQWFTRMAGVRLK